MSVIIITYRGCDRIMTALESLVAQTLAPERFEAVVVANGADDGTLALVEDFAKRHPMITVRIVHLPFPSAANAWNVGFASAQFAYVTLLDDDDWLSPRYLEALYDHAAPHRVTIAPFADVDAGAPASEPSFVNYLNELLYLTPGGDHSFRDNPSAAAAANSGKLVATHLARSARFSLDLTSGMDVLYWSTLFSRHDLRLFVLPPDSGAVYYRTVSPSSMSRAFGDVYVDDRFKVIKRLGDLAAMYPRHTFPLGQLAKGQSANLGRAVNGNHTNYLAVSERAASEQLPLLELDDFNSTAADLLVCAYVFSPFVDPSAVTMVKRLHAAGEPFNIITFDMASIRLSDHEMDRLVLPWLGNVQTIHGTPLYMHPKGDFAFAASGLALAKRRMGGREPYRRLYSRSMWPASHVLAASIKALYPDIEWTAEFSDPISFNAKGKRNKILLERSHPLFGAIEGAIRAQGVDNYGGDLYPGWLEHSVMALADHIVFTNEKQRDFMLGYQLSKSVGERALGRSVISPHPTFERAVYELSDPDYSMSPDRVNIGYFGSFYPTRGIGVVVDALMGLTAAQRAGIALHLFVQDPDKASAHVDASGLAETVEVSAYRPLLEFLALADRMDWLLVADAQVTSLFGTNPYLPSKYSDYAGALSKVWGIVEPGSPLDSCPLDHKTRLGDTDAATQFLRSLAESARGRYVPSGDMRRPRLRAGAEARPRPRGRLGSA